MKYVDEYRNARLAESIINEIRRIQTRPWVIMEVCGGQTHSIVKNGIDRLLPDGVELVHGPGCPVCVTPLETIDKAHAIAARPNVIFCSFGDMLRVPGSNGDLFTLKSQGADIRVVYSPLDCLKIARTNPGKEVVFFATVDAHSMSPVAVLELVRAMGGQSARVLVVGCEPETLETDPEGNFGLSAPVDAAVDEAIRMIEDLITTACSKTTVHERKGETKWLEK